MHLLTRVILCIAALAVTGSCAKRRQRPAVLHGPEVALTAEDYQDVLDTWTRGDRVYQQLDNKLFVTSTFHSPELRRAFAIAFPDIYGHGGRITRRELVELSDGIEQYHTFFVSAFTPERRWNDFHKDDSIWKLSLVNQDRSISIEPEEIQSIKIDENLRAVYSYLGRFDEAYLVRFKLADDSGTQLIPAGADSFTLRIASALGVAELTWKLAKAHE